MADADIMGRVFGKKADEGDAGFAIAYALLEVADVLRDIAGSQEAVATALKYLGTGDAGTSMGAIEFLGAQVEKAGDRIAHALEETANDSAPPSCKHPPDA